MYPDGTHALMGVDLVLAAGEEFTLLGLNGAGETTFLRMPGTQLRPSSGVVRVIRMETTKPVRQLRGRFTASALLAHGQGDGLANAAPQ